VRLSTPPPPKPAPAGVIDLCNKGDAAISNKKQKCDAGTRTPTHVLGQEGISKTEAVRGEGVARGLRILAPLVRVYGSLTAWTQRVELNLRKEKARRKIRRVAKTVDSTSVTGHSRLRRGPVEKGDAGGRKYRTASF